MKDTTCWCNHFSPSSVLRKATCILFLTLVSLFYSQKEEGKVQGQLNHTDSSQYIRDLKDQIVELKHEVRPGNKHQLISNQITCFFFSLLVQIQILFLSFLWCWVSEDFTTFPQIWFFFEANRLVQVLTTPRSFLCRAVSTHLLQK